MKIDKIINNNVIVSADSHGREIVAMGRGLAFARKTGDSIDDALAEKVFTLGSGDLATKFQQVAAEIPVEHMLLTERIIAFAKSRYDMTFHDSIYVSLPDHISTALERYASGMKLSNPMLLDIRRLYREEYEIGEKAIELVFQETGVRFENDEAGFIAMHFVNAELNGDMSGMYNITRIIDEISSVVREWTGSACDEESITWYRFMTHVRFFAHRIVTDSDYPDEEYELYDIVKQKYEDSFLCARRVADLVAEKFGHAISREEMTYLVMHIERISARK